MLKQRAFSATLWSGADILLRQGLQFLVAVVLARLLSPAEFGTVALLALFTAIATVFVDSGLSAALIQRQDTDIVDESTAFWFNLGVGAVASLVLMLIAPFVAGFYRLPVLAPLLMVMALNVFVGALGAIHITLLKKHLRFRLQMAIGVVAATVSGSIAVVMAVRGYGAWALATQIVAMTSITTALLWLSNAWRPAWVFSRASALKLFGFGGYYMGANLLEVAYSRLYTVIVGKLFGLQQVGIYGNADSTVQLPGGFLTGVFGRVVFPMFSAATGDPDKLQRGMQFAVRAMMLINIPMMLGLAALAEPFVRTVFGEKWIAAVPILRVLCVAGVLTPLHMINTHTLLAHGQSRLLFRIETGKKLMGIVLIAAGSFFGLIGIAWSQVAYSVLAFVLSAHFTGRLVAYGAGRQMRDALPSLGLGLGMAWAVHAAASHWNGAPHVKLLVLTLVGAVSFLVLGWALRIDALADVLTLFRRRAADAD